MNREVITIGSAVFAGALSKGLTGNALETSSNTVKLLASLGLAAVSGYLATKVKGDTTKDAALRGAAVGVSVAQGLEAVKYIFSTPAMQSKIASNKFLSKAVGLAGAEMNGYIDANGNYREDGMNGYIDINGNYIEDGMNGYYDENGNYIDDSMGGYYDEYGNYVDDSMGGYYDQNGNYIDDSMGAYADEQGQYAL